MKRCSDCQFLLTALLVVVTSVSSLTWAQEKESVMRIGMIGLDTSHAPAFAGLFNGENATGNLAKMKVVAAYPGGSPDIPSSRDRIEGFTQKLRELDVAIVDSIDELVQQVDAVLLESVDGRTHLEQVYPVFRAGKPVFIDKPLAGDLADALAIDLLAKEYGARWFSSSSLRFSPSILQFREDPKYAEGIMGASAWSPCSLEPHHTDLYWYGVHGVETLYTAMGMGCKHVTRVHTDDTDLVVGQWDGGRVGVFRGIRKGKTGYGLVVFGKSEIYVGGKYEGYAPLVERIADFFAGAEAPVATEETLEMFTFMEAADRSKELGGTPVSLDDMRRAGLEEAARRLTALTNNEN